MTPKTIKMGDGDWVLVFWEQHNSLFGPPGRPGVDFGASEVDLGASGVDFQAQNRFMLDFGTPFLHFSGKMRF